MTPVPAPATPASYDRWYRYYDIGDGDLLPFQRFYSSLMRQG